MKKFLVIVVLLMVVACASFAQPVIQTANITANVNVTLTLAKLTDLAALTANQGQTVFFASNVAQAASFLFTGAASASTTVGVAFPATVSDGTNTMTFTGQIPRTNVAANPATSTALAAITGGTATTTGIGQLWIYAGGGVTAAPTQPAGQYTGVITVTVSQP
jgi:hypothetical protein